MWAPSKAFLLKTLLHSWQISPAFASWTFLTQSCSWTLCCKIHRQQSEWCAQIDCVRQASFSRRNFFCISHNETVHNVSPCLFLILHLALPRCESCVPLLMFRMQSLDLQCIMCQQAGFKHLSWRKVDFIALSQSLFTVQNIYLDIVLACCLNPCVVIIQLLFSEKFQTAFETPTFFMHHKIWIWKKCFLFSDMIKKNTGEWGAHHPNNFNEGTGISFSKDSGSRRATSFHLLPKLPFVAQSYHLLQKAKS